MKAAYWIISAAITVAGLGLMAEGRRQMSKSVKAEDGGQSIRTEHFASAANLDIDLGSADIKVLTAKDAEDITVTVINPRDSLIIECNDDTLTVKQETEFSLFNIKPNSKPMQMTITAPESTNFKEVKVDLGSGNLSEMSGFSLRTLDVDLGSGNAAIRTLDIVENCKIHTGSGNASAEDCKVGGEVTLDNGSGNIGLNGCDLREDLEVRSGSGDLKINSTKLAKDMKVKIGSGNIKGEALEVGGKTDWNFGSGTAKIDGFTPADDVTIDIGSGGVELTLTGKEDDYGYDTSDISGGVVIGDKKAKKIEDIKDGKPTIKVKGGSGSMKIGFAQ